MNQAERDKKAACEQRFLGKAFLVHPSRYLTANLIMRDQPLWHPECGFVNVCSGVFIRFGEAWLLSADNGYDALADRCVTLAEYIQELEGT